ncbi:hypothetical protein E4U14_000491, partial [Claviceps sp. LM454 group G7]
HRITQATNLSSDADDDEVVVTQPGAKKSEISFISFWTQELVKKARDYALTYVLHTNSPFGASDDPSMIPHASIEPYNVPNRSRSINGPIAKLHNFVLWVRSSPQRSQIFTGIFVENLESDHDQDTAESTAELDTAAESTAELQLILNNVTRWNSTYLMIERALRKHDKIVAFLATNNLETNPNHQVPATRKSQSSAFRRPSFGTWWLGLVSRLLVDLTQQLTRQYLGHDQIPDPRQRCL